jgi:hypothetical protein
MTSLGRHFSVGGEIGTAEEEVVAILRQGIRENLAKKKSFCCDGRSKSLLHNSISSPGLLKLEYLCL